MTTILVYLDNNLLGPNLEQDLGEKKALKDLEKLNSERDLGIELLTSNRTANEYEKWKNQAKREAMQEDHATKGRVAQDHEVKDFFNMFDQYGGGGSFPMVSDVPDKGVFDNLRTLGIEEMDAKHVAIAIHNKCDYFLTRDQKSILNYRDKIEASFSIKLRRPSELLAELATEESHQ